MDQQMMESLKGKSREERAEYFKSHKSQLISVEDLKTVSGGATSNPDSSVPWKGNYYTSWGFACRGYHFCG